MNPSILTVLYEKPEALDSYWDKPFRLKQLKQYIFEQKIFDFYRMTTIPQTIRNKLAEDFSITKLKPIKQFESSDQTVKFLFELDNETYIEAVILKDKNSRYTFCISTQSGCRMGCLFCKTGKMKFIRNLDYTEIISQILFFANRINTSYNIVFMGMGEPLDNFDQLIKSIRILTDPSYLGLSSNRITVSTCGITDKILPLLNNFSSISLAVSLNSLIQEKREILMPITKAFPLNSLIETLYQCQKKFKIRITLEYILIKNFNMEIEDLLAFDKLRKNDFMINLIPLNDTNIENFECPDENEIKSFSLKLKNKGYNVTRRYRRGNQIQADCGQLFWDNNNITR